MFAEQVGLPCVSLLGSQLAPEDIIGVPQIVDVYKRQTDEQIARYMDMARRTVNTRRHKAYRLLKELMGGEADE